jgi:hypothetical protein
MIILEIQVQNIAQVSNGWGQEPSEVVSLEVELAQFSQRANPVGQGSTQVAVGHEQGLQLHEGRDARGNHIRCEVVSSVEK